jgi:hypothetical protein
MWRIFGGAALVVAGIAAFVEASRHHPVSREVSELGPPREASALSPTNYDILHVGARALVIFGTLLVIVGLVRLVQRR